MSRCNNYLVLLIKDVDGLVSIHLGFTLVMIFFARSTMLFHPNSFRELVLLVLLQF